MDPSFQNRLDPFQRIILILHITRKADAHRIISQAKFLSNTTAAVKLQMLIIHSAQSLKHQNGALDKNVFNESN